LFEFANSERRIRRDSPGKVHCRFEKLIVVNDTRDEP
jgi:hypothetical protein